MEVTLHDRLNKHGQLFFMSMSFCLLWISYYKRADIIEQMSENLSSETFVGGSLQHLVYIHP